MFSISVLFSESPNTGEAKTPDKIISGGTFVHYVIFLQLISKLARNIRA